MRETYYENGEQIFNKGQMKLWMRKTMMKIERCRTRHFKEQKRVVIYNSLSNISIYVIFKFLLNHYLLIN